MENLLDRFNKFDWEAILLNLGLTGGRVILILVLAWVAWMIIGAALKRLEARLQRKAELSMEGSVEASNRSKTLTALLRQGLFILVLATLALMLMKELGIMIAPILASAGIVGLAVGFGAQNLVRDVISGFFLIFEDQVSVGDVAVINGTGGVVEEINFRTLILRDLEGTVHIFPNGAITTLANLTRTWSGYVFNIGIDYKEDPDRAISIMRETGEAMRADEQFGPMIIEPMEIFGVDKLTESSVVIQGRIKTRPLKQWDVGREYLKRIKKAFEEQDIEIPCPQERMLSFSENSMPLLARLMQEIRHADTKEKPLATHRAD